MRVLIAGASGFIGSHLAADLMARGHCVTGAARSLDSVQKRLAAIDWIACDFRHDSREDWTARLAGFDAVINCVGVLQNGLGDDSHAAHIAGARALFEGARDAGVRRVIHISAAGADAEAGTAYARDKQAGEAALRALDLDWVILRPSLVVHRNVYGGTGMIRALCGIPFLTPLVGGEQRFRPLAMDDLSGTIEALIQPDAPARVTWDIGGPETMTLKAAITAYRAWLGFGATRILAVPRWLARPAFWWGDLLGWLGVRTAMRSTSLAQLDHDAAGDPSDWIAATGAKPQSLTDYLAAHPAGVQDRWHARLGFARPIALWVLGLYWLITGILSLTVAKPQALIILAEAGFDPAVQGPLLWATSLFDCVLGAGLLLKWRVRLLASLMIAGTLGYVLALTFTLPALWADALGPVLKVFPAAALALMIAATEDDR